MGFSHRPLNLFGLVQRRSIVPHHLKHSFQRHTFMPLKMCHQRRSDAVLKFVICA